MRREDNLLKKMTKLAFIPMMLAHAPLAYATTVSCPTRIHCSVEGDWTSCDILPDANGWSLTWLSPSGPNGAPIIFY